MTRALTARQEEVAEAIYRLFVRLGRTPTYAELCGVFGLRSASTIWSHVRALEQKGILRSDPGKDRNTIAFSEVSLQRLVVLIPEYLAGRDNDGKLKVIPNSNPQEMPGDIPESVHKES